MKSSAKKVKLASVDDLFSTEESRSDESREKVVELPLSELHSFKNHPFKVKDDEAMMDTAESIRTAPEGTGAWHGKGIMRRKSAVCSAWNARAGINGASSMKRAS